MIIFIFFFQAEDGIRDLVRSRGLGDVYKRQAKGFSQQANIFLNLFDLPRAVLNLCNVSGNLFIRCLLYTSDAADDLLCVDLGGRRIIKKKKKKLTYITRSYNIYQLTHI